MALHNRVRTSACSSSPTQVFKLGISGDAKPLNNLQGR